MADFDLLVIGGGPGGYVAAVRAATLGLRTALVEERELGGTCLQRGCIPTKTLIESARAVHLARSGKSLGFSAAEVAPDLPAMVERKRRVVSTLEKGVAALLKKRGVEVLAGRARLTAAGAAEVVARDGTSRAVSASKVILATGSRPAALPFLPADGRAVFDSDTIMDLGRLPASLAVIGGGVLGCEFATLYAQLGVQVTVVEMLDRLLPTIDADCAAEVTRALKKLRVKVQTGARIESAEARAGAPCRLVLAGGAAVETEAVLVAAGRRPNSADLGLEAIGVAVERGFVKVDNRCRTSVPGVWAIGDLTGGWMLAHAASRMGLVAAADAAGKLGDERYEFDKVPGAVFTDPEVGSVGLTLQAANARGLAAEERAFPFRMLGRSACGHDLSGVAKLVYGRDSRRVLGVHICGPHASDLIGEGALAVSAGLTVEQLAATVHAHPTYAEALYEAAEAAVGLPVHGL
ncbi:MAG TPA: dihydrolipoyl dehydrogenase [Planctomycetota bacterium]|nr:dihydrolipoyl dehydrogenase [Planctomycetota bacterium]